MVAFHDVNNVAGNTFRQRVFHVAAASRSSRARLRSIPSDTGQCAIVADDPWQGICDSIALARKPEPRHEPTSAIRCACDVSVARDGSGGISVRHSSPAAECGSTDVQRKIESGTRSLDEPHYLDTNCSILYHRP